MHLDLDTDPRVLIVKENDKISNDLSKIILQDSNAFILIYNMDIIRMNQLINSLKPENLGLDIDLTDRKALPAVFNTPQETFNSQSNTPSSKEPDCSCDWIGLPTNTGIRFTNKSDIVYFSYRKKNDTQKEKWEVVLTSTECFQLKTNTTSKDILKHFSDTNFVQLCQKCIVNIKYIHSIETKTHKCFLNSPFNNEEITISRSCLNEIKERFDF